MKDRKNSSLLGRLDKFQRLFFVALLSVLAVGAFAQSKTVSGTVLDKTGESVIGASVVVKGTTNGTITDFDGKFTLQNVPDNGTIQVSFVGYKTVDIQVKGQSTVKVILEEDTETLDEVVVVGYGNQQRLEPNNRLGLRQQFKWRQKPWFSLFSLFPPQEEAIADTTPRTRAIPAERRNTPNEFLYIQNLSLTFQQK